MIKLEHNIRKAKSIHEKRSRMQGYDYGVVVKKPRDMGVVIDEKLFWR